MHTGTANEICKHRTVILRHFPVARWRLFTEELVWQVLTDTSVDQQWPAEVKQQTKDNKASLYLETSFLPVRSPNFQTVERCACDAGKTNDVCDAFCHHEAEGDPFRLSNGLP